VSASLSMSRKGPNITTGRFLELLGTSDEAIAAYLPAGSTHLGRRAARRSSYHHALPSSKHLVIATGGTFNHLHSGHKRLLSTTALMLRSSTTTPSRIVVEIAADDLLKNNAYAEFANFESWKLREEAVARFLIKLLLYPGVSYKDGVERIERSPASGLEVITRLKQFAITIECIELHDHFGPTITDDTITALVVSRQEHHRGIAINTKRREIGCKPLEVIEVDSPDAKEAEATNQDDEEFNAAETLTFCKPPPPSLNSQNPLILPVSQGLPPAPSAPSLSSPVQPPLHIAPPPTALLPQPRSPFDAPPPPFTLQAPVPSALITLPAPVIPATPRLRPVRDIDIDMPPIQLPPLLLPLAPKLCAEHFYDAPRLEGIPTRERGREREDGGQGEREEQAEVLDVPGPDPQASPLGARTGRTALQEPVLQGRTPLPSAPRRMARQVAVEEVGESSRSGAERERMRRLVENEERNAREAEMEMEEIDMGSSSGASSGGERMGDRKGKGRAQEYNLATPPDSRPPSAGSVVEPVQSGSIPPHSPAPAASPSPPVRRPLPRVVNTHYPNRKPTCADFIRTALRLLNRHAQKRDIHRVVDRLCRNQGERLYKDQSIRKALCQQETGLRRRGDGWGLPEWGTEGGEVERRFGSGPGTSQARMSRMRRRP